MPNDRMPSTGAGVRDDAGRGKALSGLPENLGLPAGHDLPALDRPAFLVLEVDWQVVLVHAAAADRTLRGPKRTDLAHVHELRRESEILGGVWHPDDRPMVRDPFHGRRLRRNRDQRRASDRRNISNSAEG